MPFLWALMWVCISFSPIRLWQNYHQALPLVLIVIFYYALFDYRRLNVFMVFILGLLTDFLSFGSIGLNCFIYVLFSYPEKFWKIANGYYNSNKAFLSPKYTEKLQTVIEQEREKNAMLEEYSAFHLQGN